METSARTVVRGACVRSTGPAPGDLARGDILIEEIGGGRMPELTGAGARGHAVETTPHEGRHVPSCGCA